jgi:uncharacterized protein YkwD
MKKLLIFFFVLSARFVCAQQDVAAAKWEAESNRGWNADFLSSFEKEIIFEINKARTNSALYAQLYIEPMIGDFKGKVNRRTNVETTEGIAVIKECVRILKKTAPIGLLDPNSELYQTALYHTSRQSKTNEVGHTSPDGKTFADRLRLLHFTSSSECISYGENTARGVVAALLIDDGVSDRGHRKTILDPKYKLIGVSSGSHKTYGYMSTLDFAANKAPGF